MRVLPPEEHLRGHLVISHGFPAEYESLKRALAGLKVPLRPASPFTRGGRGQTPKRQKAQGTSQYKLLPVDQVELNRQLAESLHADGWATQPIAAGDMVNEQRPLRLKGDFVRNKVFVEVEFGNAASVFRDLFKFQVASRAKVGEVAVLVVATERLGRMFDSGVATLEHARRLMPYLSIGIQMPIWICGIEPDDFDDIRNRYDEMLSVCEKNGVPCISFDDASSAPTAY